MESNFELSEDFEATVFGFVVDMCENYDNKDESPDYIVSQIIAALEDIENNYTGHAVAPKTIKEFLNTYGK